MPSNMHEYIPYSAITDRPPLHLPDNGRIAIWTIVNVEHWLIGGAMPRTVLPPPLDQPRLPDIANWSWHEYGMRVGFWRFIQLFDRLGIRPTLAINGRVCESYPRITEAAADRGWDFMGHGFEQLPMHNIEDQDDAIAKTIDAIRRATGKPPRGWESPGLTQTHETAAALKRAGIEYIADLVMDDQPCRVETKDGPLVALPYTVEMNDVVMTAVQQHPSKEIFTRGIDQFERLYAESKDSARVMAISLHPYLTGVPHRIGHVEALYERLADSEGVAFMNGSEILDWWQDASQDDPAQTSTVS